MVFQQNIIIEIFPVLVSSRAPIASLLGQSCWVDLTYCGAGKRMSRGSGNPQQLTLGFLTTPHWNKCNQCEYNSLKKINNLSMHCTWWHKSDIAILIHAVPNRCTILNCQTTWTWFGFITTPLIHSMSGRIMGGPRLCLGRCYALQTYVGRPHILCNLLWFDRIFLWGIYLMMQIAYIAYFKPNAPCWTTKLKCDWHYVCLDHSSLFLW